MTVSDYDLNHPMPMHAAIARFVQEAILVNPEGYTGGFGYRIDVYRTDGTGEPFSYTTVDESQR